jgi:hypothetical protein
VALGLGLARSILDGHVCVCAHVCAHVCTHVCAHVCTHVCVHVYIGMSHYCAESLECV